MSAALQSDRYNLKMICDVNEELCRQRSKEFDFQNYTTNYNEMLNDPGIDVIAIYTPDHLHAEHVKQALEHNKHVVCTKPFIDDLSKAKELLELKERSGKKVFIGQSSRFFEPMKRQRLDFESQPTLASDVRFESSVQILGDYGRVGPGGWRERSIRCSG